MDAVSEDFFQLKADFVPLTILKITQYNINGICKQLEATLKKAPNYFHGAPIVIDVSMVPQENFLNLAEIIAFLKEKQLIPVAIRGLSDSQQSTQLGLASLNKTTSPENKKKKIDITSKAPARSPTKIITKPIRSGTQVYAKGGDLIILAGVNPGAECFADGNIHVYGPLRGRALAGVSGDTNARIFCKSLEAELIAIAGHYQVNEKIKAPTADSGMVQVFLDNQQLQINTI